MDPVLAPSETQIGFIIREREPVNFEYPFDQLNTFLTPNDQFYIRSHFKAPVLDRHDYRLSVGGAVQHPFAISYEELLAMPSVTRPATLECAGNGRIFLVPQVKGAQWQLGRGQHGGNGRGCHCLRCWSAPASMRARAKFCLKLPTKVYPRKSQSHQAKRPTPAVWLSTRFRMSLLPTR